MTLAEFAALRAADCLETDVAELWIDDEFSPWRDNQVTYPETRRVRPHDFRVFVGLSVFVHTAKYTNQVVEIFDGLKKYADYVLVAVVDFGEDLGFEFRKAQA